MLHTVKSTYKLIIDNFCPATVSLCPPILVDVVPLCDLYSVINIVIFPSSNYSTINGTSNQNGLHRVNGSNGINGTDHRASNSEAFSPLAAALTAISLGPANWSPSSLTVFTAILPLQDGYIYRSDFLQLRLQDCPIPIVKIYENVKPLEKYKAWTLPLTTLRTEEALASAIEQGYVAGVIQWASLEATLSVVDMYDHLKRLVTELRCRLHNAPWLTSKPIPRKRVALIRGRPNLTAGGPIYRTARALGLELVIVDEPGHWLQPDTEENKMYREAFLATDMTEDEGVVDRIVKSLRSYPLPIHGVFTLSDNFFVTVARVAELLGLPCNPSSAFEISVDKYRSRLLQEMPGRIRRVKTMKDCKEYLESPERWQGTLIVKPTKGWSSECVSKVTRVGDLWPAISKAIARHGTDAVIEPFYDGPEIDANFILQDGEILFSEIADEPPFEADSPEASPDSTFSPEALTMPSALPTIEQEIAKSTLRDLLLKAGFHTGVFHVEARIVCSSAVYKDVDGSGVVDLIPKHKAGPARLQVSDSCYKMTPADRLSDTNGDIENPECKLLEINARPPGYRVTVPARHTYGVDYFAAHMLACIGDTDRLRLAACPFAFQDYPEHMALPAAQYHSRIVYIPAPAAGIVRWPVTGVPPCEELKQRRPDLANYIVLGVDYCVPGDKIELQTDGARTYVAHLLVVSRESRRKAIEIGNEVAREYRIIVEGGQQAKQP